MLINWMKNNTTLVYSINGGFAGVSLILLILLWVYYSKMDKSTTLAQYRENNKIYRGILAVYTVIIIISIIIFGGSAYVYKIF